MDSTLTYFHQGFTLIRDDCTTLLTTPSLKGVMYTLVHTEKGYRVLKEKVFFLDGMQVKFLYDLEQTLIPDVDMVSLYFDSLQQFEELVTLDLICTRPYRTPSPGEKCLVVSEGFLYYQIRASVFRPKLTEKGETLLKELKTDNLFTDCMTAMDMHMVTHLTGGPL